VSLLLAVIWIPVIVVQMLRMQSTAGSQISIVAAHQAHDVSRSLMRAAATLDWLASQLEEEESWKLEESVLASRVFALMRGVRVECNACLGAAFTLRNDYLMRFNFDPELAVFGSTAISKLRELARSSSRDSASKSVIVAPYTTESGLTNALVVKVFRRGEGVEAALMAYEFQLQQLVGETLIKDPAPALTQELCDAGGNHILGAERLREQYPVISLLSVPGGEWQLLTVPESGWFSLFPPEILFFSVVGLLMVSGSSLAVYRLTCRYGRLNSELREKSEALNAAHEKMSHDFNTLQAAQRRLAENELRTRVIYDRVSFGLALLDGKTGQILHLNPCGHQILGLSDRDLARLRIEDVLLLNDTVSAPSALGLSAVVPGEYFVRSGVAGLRRISLQLAPVVPREGEPERVLAVLQDETQRWQAEQDLRDHEERIRVLAETLPGPLLYIDRERRCRFANRAALQVLQELAGDAWVDPIGRRTEEFVAPPVYQFLQPFIEGALLGESIQFETTEELERLVGGAWIGFHRPLIRGGVVQGFFAFLVNISEQRRTESERRDLAKRVSEAHRMETVGTLAGGVAHEFNNMLQVVLGLADVLLERFREDAFAQENLNQIRYAGRRASDLTTQLLAFARFQPGSPLQLNFSDLVPGSLKLLRHAAGTGVDLKWSCERGLHNVLIDGSHLDLILANLILNSSHAMSGPGVIEIRARNLGSEESVEPGLAAAGQPSVVLSVMDNGCGMTPEVQARMFDPFFTTRAVGKGTGLGLSTVYGLVVQNGGRIDVRSAPGRGTAIHLLFPSCGPRGS
jgi:signal transduction histidine kinase